MNIIYINCIQAIGEQSSILGLVSILGVIILQGFRYIGTKHRALQTNKLYPEEAIGVIPSESVC